MAGNETELMETGGRMARDVGSRAISEGGGFFSGLIGAPFSLIGNIARQGFSGIMSWGIPAALLTGGAMLFTPDLFIKLKEMTGDHGQGLISRLASSVGENGVGTAALIAAGTGAAVGGGVGVLSAVWQSMTGGGPQSDAPRSTGQALGQTIGTVATFGAIAAVAAGVMTRNSSIVLDRTANNDVVPPATPGRAGSANRNQA